MSPHTRSYNGTSKSSLGRLFQASDSIYLPCFRSLCRASIRVPSSRLEPHLDTLMHAIQRCCFLLVDFMDYARAWRLDQSANAAPQRFIQQRRIASISSGVPRSTLLSTAYSSAPQVAYQPALLVQRMRACYAAVRDEGFGAVGEMATGLWRAARAAAGGVVLLGWLLIDLLDYARAYRD